MAIITKPTGTGGGGGGTTIITPSDYVEVFNTDLKLTSKDQYAIVKSDVSSSSVTFPDTSDIEDGHFVVLARSDGLNPQYLSSDDATLSSPPTTSVTPLVNLPLNGNIIDTASGSAYTQSTNTGFNFVDWLGQSHDGFEVQSGATGAIGLTTTFTPVTGDQQRTIYFQYKANSVVPLRDKAGFFGLGDATAPNRLFALELEGNSGDLRIHTKNLYQRYLATDMPDLFDGDVHTIAITSASSNISGVELYIDDFNAPIAKSSIVGTGGSINTANTGLTVGYSRANDDCIEGIYSNFRIYDQVLSKAELRFLQVEGLASGVVDLSILEIDSEVRYIYDKTTNVWQAQDAALLRLVDHTNRLNALETTLSSYARNGFGDYNDTSTTATPLVLTANTWTTIPNNNAGAFTNTAYLPDRCTRLMNPAGQILVDELDLGDFLHIRNDFKINPSVDNGIVDFRYQLGTGADAYELETLKGRLDDGSGKDYRFNLGTDFIYVGDLNTRDNPITIQVKLSVDGTLVNAGTVIGVVKRG